MAASRHSQWSFDETPPGFIPQKIAWSSDHSSASSEGRKGRYFEIKPFRPSNLGRNSEWRKSPFWMHKKAGKGAKGFDLKISDLPNFLFQCLGMKPARVSYFRVAGIRHPRLPVGGEMLASFFLGVQFLVIP